MNLSSTNPSNWTQRLLVCFVGGVAFLIATYMALYQWKLIGFVWDPVFDGETMKVLDSPLSHQLTQWIRIPDASLGAIAYLGDVLFSLAGSRQRWYDRPWLVLVFGLDVIPVGAVSVILVAMQGLVVGSWCFPCWITASISLILIFLAYGEVKATLMYLFRVWKRTRDVHLLWRTLLGYPSAVANEVIQEIIAERKK